MGFLTALVTKDTDYIAKREKAFVNVDSYKHKQNTGYHV